MVRTILVIGTLDTKAEELVYLQRRIEAEGVKTLLMDVSCKSGESKYRSDVSCRMVAGETGKELEEIAQLDKISALRLMTDGATKIAERMVVAGEFHGIIGLGGANGAEMACSVMRILPIGFPKLMVTPVASGNVRPYVGTKDIMMANSIGDISLNSITKRVMNNAARAIANMAKAGPLEDEEIKPQICISTFGVTLPCVERAKSLLEERGFEVIELHSSGTGGMALEELVRTGEISGVLDITTSELVDELVGGMYSAGSHRIEAAGSMGVPQVISVGALDFGDFGGKETVPEKYRNRNFFFYTPSITLMRTDVEENRILGKTIAEKVNRSTGPTAIVIPLKGFSALDRSGGAKMTTFEGSVSGEWHDETANSALIESIKKHLDSSRVKLMEVDTHINDPEFAEIAVDLLASMMKAR
jgi:uncharacterized protein (UPF0261 family)